ncbi:unnamed protein product [Discosporangium mesarthrocarpum]
MATDDKYDRQLRLWGTAGQKELMEANILLINAGPTGTETLKNLVLPGVGRFTVLDPATVQPSDLGNNFFVTADKIGCLRAQAGLCGWLRSACHKVNLPLLGVLKHTADIRRHLGVAQICFFLKFSLHFFTLSARRFYPLLHCRHLSSVLRFTSCYKRLIFNFFLSSFKNDHFLERVNFNLTLGKANLSAEDRCPQCIRPITRAKLCECDID